MSEKARPGRDAFAFSLLGLKTMAGYTTACAIAHDRINRAWDDKLDSKPAEPPAENRETPAASGRFWLSKRHGTA